jgi:hypothetical protein
MLAEQDVEDEPEQLSVRNRQIPPSRAAMDPELADLLAKPIVLGALLTVERPLVIGAALAAIDPGLPHPVGQAAGTQAKALGNGIGGKALPQAELNSFHLPPLRRESETGLGGGGRRWTL